MRKYNRIFNFIAVFIFIGFFWVITVFVTFSFPKHNNSLKELLPDDVEIIISVNADQIIKTLLIDALYKTDFSENDLKLLERGTSSQKTESPGIEFNSDIVMFYDVWNKIPVQGFLFNLSNKKEFDRYRLKGQNDIKKTNGKQGIIILLNDEASKELIAYSTQFAEQLMTKKSRVPASDKDLEMLSLKYKGDQYSYIEDLKLSAKIEEERILLNGSGKKNKTLSFSVGNYNLFSEVPKEKYLEIQSGQLPDSLYQYFDFIFDEIGIKVPIITSQQMLIYGISIENISGSTVFLPKFDWILRFDSIIDLKSQLGSIGATTERMQVIDKKSIQIGGTKYYYKQISEQEIYIGVTEFPAIQSKKTQILPLMRGFPSAALEIEGKGIIASFINIMPQVKNTKVFMENVEYFDIHTTNKNRDQLEIIGEIRLKEGKMMSVELVKFILMFVK